MVLVITYELKVQDHELRADTLIHQSYTEAKLAQRRPSVRNARELRVLGAELGRHLDAAHRSQCRFDGNESGAVPLVQFPDLVAAICQGHH